MAGQVRDVAWRGKAGHGTARQGKAREMQTIDTNGAKAQSKGSLPSIDARLLADELGRAGLEIVSYPTLSGLIGRNVQGAARSYLLTARRIVLREKGFVFRPVRNLGLRRLRPEETAACDDRFEHVRRTHKQTIRELKTVDISALPETARAGCIARMSLAAFTVYSHGGEVRKRMEAASSSVENKLDLTATLEAFREIE